MPFKDKERQIQGNTNSPSLEIKTLVSNYFRDANGSPSSPPNQKRSLATSPIKSNSSSPDRQKKELQTSRLACVRESLRLNKVPERVSKIIFASWWPGTEKYYQSSWRKFNSWCEERSINSISCPITEILSFCLICIIMACNIGLLISIEVQSLWHMLQLMAVLLDLIQSFLVLWRASFN